MPPPPLPKSVTTPSPSVAPPPPITAPPSDRAPVQPPAPPAPEAVAPTDPAPVSDSAPVSVAAPTPATPAMSDASASSTVTLPRSDAAHLNNPKPVYPAVSRRLKEEGTVVLDVFILADGSVGELRVKRSSGFSRLDEAALAAVRRWKYVPARRGSEPLALWYSQSLVFSLVR